MFNIDDIRSLLIQEVRNHNIKDCGYDCMNGRKYVEIRNVVFECNKGYIFSGIKKIPKIDKSWYEENYTPILYKDDQLVKCWNILVDNPNSRQAVIVMTSTDNLQCTMYMHVSLLPIGNDTYELEYSVHMRSNDAIEFRTDYNWHMKVYEYLFTRLSTYYNVVKKNIIWCVDSLQLYEQYFDNAVKS